MRRKAFTQAYGAFKRGWHLDTSNKELTQACQQAHQAMCGLDQPLAAGAEPTAGATSSGGKPKLAVETSFATDVLGGAAEKTALTTARVERSIEGGAPLSMPAPIALCHLERDADGVSRGGVTTR